MNIDILTERVLLSRLAFAMATGGDVEKAREALRKFYQRIGLHA